MTRILRATSVEDLQRILGKNVTVRGHVLECDAPVPKPKANKFHAQPTEVEGIRFHSKKEAKRYQTLRALEAMGKITDLQRQVAFPLVVNGERVTVYVCDFTYRQDGKFRAEDVKGCRSGAVYELFRVKARLFEALMGTKVEEV